MQWFRKTVGQRAAALSGNLGLLALGILVALLLAEAVLRVYNPLDIRARGYRIVLPVNRVYRFENLVNPKLDRTIVHTKNSLGFRGDEPPLSPDSVLTVLTVGGSTTECLYLSDGKTWTDVLGSALKETFSPVWINNAGLDGHTTFGHRVLMDTVVKMRVKPKLVLFLIGANDYEQTSLDSVSIGGPRSAFRRLVNHSEVLALGLNVYRFLQARQRGLVHGDGWLLEQEQINDLRNLPRVQYPDSAREAVRREHRERYLPGYMHRVQDLIADSRRHGVEPVLVTQPALLGDVTDDVTGVPLGSIRWHDMDVAERWNLMELYNDVTRQVGKETGTVVIDLAKKMPKSSRYFYDWLHFTNDGAVAVGAIVFHDLCPFLGRRYRPYERGACPAGLWLR